MRLSPEMEDLIRELQEYERNGCTICLGGRPSRPWEVAAACFRENSTYMRDVESDDSKIIRKINFIKVK